MIESIKKQQTRVKPGSVIFILAGAAHVPHVRNPTGNSDKWFYVQLKELRAFLKTQKYMVLAPKELFRNEEEATREDL